MSATKTKAKAEKTAKPYFATVPEAGAFLRVSRPTIYRLIEAGHLDARKIGSCNRITWKSLQFVAENGAEL